MRRDPADRLIVAFDDGDLAQTLRLAKRLRGLVRYAKIGSIVFTAEGPRAVAELRRLGFGVFLDLKFHDIPSTVEKSCRAAARHGVFMLTVHASGQPEMLAAAKRGVTEESARRRIERPLVVGVTVLTSVAASAATAKRRVLELAQQAKASGLDGVVASAQEAAAIRRQAGPRFGIVCPGIRLPSSDAGDQARIATPSAAIRQGATWLVVGRPITESRNPRGAAQTILSEIEGASC